MAEGFARIDEEMAELVKWRTGDRVDFLELRDAVKEMGQTLAKLQRGYEGLYEMVKRQQAELDGHAHKARTPRWGDGTEPSDG